MGSCIDSLRTVIALAGLVAAGSAPIGCGPGAGSNQAAGAGAAAPDTTILGDLARWDAATPDERRAAAEAVAKRETDFRLTRLGSFTCGGATHEIAIYSHEKSGLEFALLPGGTFTMGSPATENGRQADETQHAVTLTRSFLIATTECTQAAYERVMGANPSKWRGAELPVDQVGWRDAMQFCEKTGLALPTEEQWEFACRGATATAFCGGDADAQVRDYAWSSDDVPAVSMLTPGQPTVLGTHPVGTKKPNAFGLFDLHGNVREWCADWYGPYPAPPASGDAHVARGGSWMDTPPFLRSAARNRRSDSHQSLGFRPAKTVAP